MEPQIQKQSPSRHGRIAADKTHLLIVMDKALKEQIRELARADRRTMSAFVNCRLEELVASLEGATQAKGGAR